MAKITRFISLASINNTRPDQVCVSVRYEAELQGGKRILVLDDRGWSTSGGWQHTTLEEILETSRVVVGPDEPYGGESEEEAITNHWSYICEILAQQGIDTSAAELRCLPHDVVLSEELRDRLGS